LKRHIGFTAEKQATIKAILSHIRLLNKSAGKRFGVLFMHNEIFWNKPIAPYFFVC
jgi:hypothetical protein